MCTAVTYQTNTFYFGRNLDLEYGYNEKVTITPRNYVFQFRNGEKLETHYAMIGVATVCDGYPLYYEATNERGLSIAGLNFPGNAKYHPYDDTKLNIASFELIPYLLGKCATVDEIIKLLENTNIWDEQFNEKFKPSPLHWLAADKNKAITIEPMAHRLCVYDNQIGVLTNNPPFDYHMLNLANYMHLTAQTPVNQLSKRVHLQPYSLGMGAIGLPGDPSSASRFVRAAFTKLNAVSDGNEQSDVTQFFHILGSVIQQRGVTCVHGDAFEITRYSSCCNTDAGIYYYTTYENPQINAVNMQHEDLNSTNVIAYPLYTSTEVHWHN